MLKLFVGLINISSHPPRTTYNNVLNVNKDLCCCKQTVCTVSESTFLLLFDQADGRCCSCSSAPVL